MSNTPVQKTEKNPNCPPNFMGVFFVGLFLLGVTANYFINKEAGEDRDARTRRIAAEMGQIKGHLPPALASLSGTAVISATSDAK